MAKETLSVRISSEASLRLAELIEVRGAKSAGVVIEALIMAEHGPAPLVAPDGQLERVEGLRRERKDRVVPPPAVQRKATRQSIDLDKIAAAQDWLKKPGGKK